MELRLRFGSSTTANKKSYMLLGMVRPRLKTKRVFSFGMTSTFELTENNEHLKSLYADWSYVLWSAEELVELNQAYHVKEFVSNIFLIGSDGAENAFAFDITDMVIVKLPFIGMGHFANEKLSDTFSDFLSTKIKEENKSFLKRLFG